MLIDKNSHFEKSLNDYSFGKDKRITKAEDYKKLFQKIINTLGNISLFGYELIMKKLYD